MDEARRRIIFIQNRPLGVTICRRLADLMGGRLWAESQEGRGSSFHIELRFTLPEQLLLAEMERLTT
jgi:signal transduction histidine kinase